jgi:amino acid adenylation domain-containing protein
MPLSGPTRPLADASVVSVIARVAAARPANVALEHQGRTVTFAEFWSRAAAIATRLAEVGVSPGDRVALWADRTIDVLTAAFAIMMSGAAYVPIDPSYPAVRAKAIVEGAQPALLVYDSAAGEAAGRARLADLANLADSGMTWLDLSEFAGQGPLRGPRPPLHSGPALESLPQPNDIAYVIFTSGSTGGPKGVMIDHRALLNYSSWCAATLGGSGVGTPLFGSLGFDHAVTLIWPTLIAGDRVVLCDGVWDHSGIFAPRPTPYSLMKLTPSHLRFLDRTAHPDYRDVTRLVVLGGEALDPALVAACGDRLSGVRLVNHYGPTETTVGSLFHEFTGRPAGDTATVPIGRPIWNTRAYLVDDGLRPVATGEPAELVIAGIGVAAGYLGAGRSDSRFIDESDLGGPVGRAYRTGDHVRLLADGTVVYLGREDEQLKVGGHRIELGELRKHACAIPGVREIAFDVVRDWIDGIEAFVVADGGVSAPELAETVRRVLAAAMPSAVVPRQVHVVPELRVNAHGKTDLRATRAQIGARP